jgi:hypothetical protein
MFYYSYIGIAAVGFVLMAYKQWTEEYFGNNPTVLKIMVTSVFGYSLL